MRGRIFVRDTANNRYLGANGSWVASRQQAQHFEHTWQAMLRGIQFHRQNLDVIWEMEAPLQEIHIPVQ